MNPEVVLLCPVCKSTEIKRHSDLRRYTTPYFVYFLMYNLCSNNYADSTYVDDRAGHFDEILAVFNCISPLQKRAVRQTTRRFASSVFKSVISDTASLRMGLEILLIC